MGLFVFLKMFAPIKMYFYIVFSFAFYFDLPNQYGNRKAAILFLLWYKFYYDMMLE